jgi:hypothetical protein
LRGGIQGCGNKAEGTALIVDGEDMQKIHYPECDKKGRIYNISQGGDV